MKQQRKQGRNKPLLLLVTEERTTCGICIAASEKAYDTFKSTCIIVALESGKYYSIISPVTGTALSEKAVGRTIPYGAVMSPHQDRIIQSISIKDIQKGKIKKVASQLKSYEPKPVQMPNKKMELRFFIKQDGTHQPLHLTEVVNETTFKVKRSLKKKAKTRDTKNFLPGTKKYIQALMQAKDRMAREERQKAIQDAMPALEYEAWTNTAGKSITAKFIALTGEKVTLELERGNKEVTLNLSKLSTESQTRAKTIQAEIKAALKQGETE